MPEVEETGVQPFAARKTRVRAFLRATPGALALIAVMIVHAVLELFTPLRLDFSPEVFAVDHAWWTPITLLFTPDSWIDLVLTVVFAIPAWFVAERVLGTRKFVWIAVWGGVISSLISVTLHSVMSLVPNWHTLYSAQVADPAILAAITVSAASAFMGALWRRRVRLITISIVAMFALYASDVDAWYRVVGLVVGLVAGILLTRGNKRTHAWRSDVREGRVLMSALLLITALGPFTTLLTGSHRGVLSGVLDRFIQWNERIDRACEANWRPSCDFEQMFFFTHGIGPGILAAAPLLLMAAAAFGLRTGRRAAFILAEVTLLSIILGAVLELRAGTAPFQLHRGGPLAEILFWAIGIIVVPAAIMIALWRRRAWFQVRTTKKAARRAFWIILITFVVTFVAYIIVEWTLRSQWTDELDLPLLIRDAVARYVPRDLLFTDRIIAFPYHGAGLFAWKWVGAIFWIITIVTMLMMFTRSASGTPPEDNAYRNLLRRGGGTLGWWGTWRGNEHWVAEDGRGAVAYRVQAGVALALGDPACEPVDRERVLREFIQYAIEHGWTPAFYSVHDEIGEIFKDFGWQRVPVAEEAVLLSDTWSMAGKKGEKIRHPYTRMQREGVRVEWCRWNELDEKLQGAVADVCNAWVGDKALPEMGFTLGGLHELQDPEVQLMLALDEEDKLHAVTSWLPSWENNVRTGWTLDVMRRGPEAPNGVMEFVIASTVLKAREDGVPEVSLSGAPLAGGDSGNASPLVRGALERLSRLLEPVYGFGSLQSYKAKFRPEERQLWLTVSDPLELPAVAAAVTSAYLPGAARESFVTLLSAMKRKKS